MSEKVCAPFDTIYIQIMPLLLLFFPALPQTIHITSPCKFSMKTLNLLFLILGMAEAHFLGT